MEETIRRDQDEHAGHFAERPRHTMQIEWYSYERDIWNREIPAGRERAERGMAPPLAGRAGREEAGACLSARTSSFPAGRDLRRLALHRRRGRASSERGRPCVVMAHGIGGTRDSGLAPFAEAFAEAGLDVLLFDYRSFGASTGEPRQLGWPPRHRDDYRAAVAFARGLDGVDPERIVLWGTSWSGGHIVYVAADDPRIAAVISQAADLDGLRTLREISRYADWGQLLRVNLEALKDVLRMRAPGGAAPDPAGREAGQRRRDGKRGR